MTLLGLAILAIGVADLAAGGLGGEIAARRNAVVAIVVAVVTAAAGFLLVSAGDTWAALALLAAVLVASMGWSLLRVADVGAKHPWLALAALFVPPGILAAASGNLNAVVSPRASAWLASLPFPAVSGLEPDRFVLVVGVAVSLTATANGIVRVVLAAAGPQVKTSEDRLRGGRLIGPLERLMIFGLALAAEPTAAALVVSAKSILRFPEVSSAARDASVDSVTEYFLIGSLTSWALALAPVLFFGGS